jgi:6-phosphogluconolactonase
MRFLPLALALTSGVASAGEAPFYIGTYTSDGGSKGIYRAVLDTETGTLSEPTLVAETPGPSFLALRPGGAFLYAVRESPEGQVSSFAVQPDGTLRHLNTESAHGGGPCHVAVDRGGKNLFVANYGGGSLACLPIEADGSLAPASTVFENSGSGPNKQRQEKPHLHAIYPDAESRFVYACDLGTDEVLVFRLDAEQGKLTPAEPRSAKVPPGGGPRHLAIHPGGRFVFVNNELTNTVTAFRRDLQNGSLAAIQTIPTLPDGEPVPGNTTAEIFLDPSGKWLYVSNRGHDSIAAYAVADDGRLTLLEIEPAGVAVPRGFGIDPSGQWLVVAGQKTNDLTALKIDPSYGTLSPGPNKINVGSPVCVVFTEP